MSKNRMLVPVLLAAGMVCLPASAGLKKKHKPKDRVEEITGTGVLWRDPSRVESLDLYYGPGGREHEPHSRFTFEQEDLDGSNPKFVVRDDDGVKWKVKLGEEARPETVASRLVWAAGYFTNEDYFLPSIRVGDMPRLHRGQKLVLPDGSIPNVRLKRYLEGEKKVGEWGWRDDPFTGTREWNGLRVMMALINNWDLKDQNNSIYEEQRFGETDGAELVYMVSDLGASFGTTGLNRTHQISKGNLNSFIRSKFIRKVGSDYVDFNIPSRPALVVLVNPHEFFSRLGLEWIGRHIPRADARWTGQLLARLSPGQVRDAFRAAGYSPQEVESFTAVIESRIAELNKL